MCEDVLDTGEVSGPCDYLHAQCSTHQLNDGTQLLHMEVYCHQQQHGTK